MLARSGRRSIGEVALARKRIALTMKPGDAPKNSQVPVISYLFDS